MALESLNQLRRFGSAMSRNRTAKTQPNYLRFNALQIPFRLLQKPKRPLQYLTVNHFIN